MHWEGFIEVAEPEGRGKAAEHQTNQFWGFSPSNASSQGEGADEHNNLLDWKRNLLIWRIQFP